MKLASLRHGRDGRLVVVSRDLTRAVDASQGAPSLRAALDDWSGAEPRLLEIADALEAGRIAHSSFDPAHCAAPLPRSFGWGRRFGLCQSRRPGAARVWCRAAAT